MKLCTACHEKKAFSEFYRIKDSRRTGEARYASICKVCRRAYRKRYHHGGDRQAVTNTWIAKNKTKLREMKLVERYGLTIAEYDALLEQQAGCCAICGRVHTGKRRMQVDHDHMSGVVRGLLCHHCNLILGNAGDSIDVLLSAIEYLGGV